MKLKGVIFEDFVNYKKPSMVLEFPRCTWKCDSDAGSQVCQNGTLANYPDIDVEISKLVDMYLQNDITTAIVCAGLEPFDSFQDLFLFVDLLRSKSCTDDIVIYTGYREEEITELVEKLSNYKNVIIKFGRYIPDSHEIYDETLGVTLASNNQYAKKIS